MTYIARVWPNGEFAIAPKRKLKVRPAKKQRDTKVLDDDGLHPRENKTWAGHKAYFDSDRAALEAIAPGYVQAVAEEVAALGLSDLANSPKRAKRGTNGLTGYARKMIRNCAWMLGKRCPKYGLAMITLTLPPMSLEDERAIVNSWSEIMRQFMKWVSRRLASAGACPWIVGCCEIQEKRQAQHGGLPLHAHLLINSRVNRQWVFTPEEIQSKWNVICIRVSKVENSYNWDASTRLETVRKNAENYISKYVSKGISNPGEMMEKQGFHAPAGWWYAFGGVKEAIKKTVRYLNDDDASFLLWIWRNCDYAVRYRYDVGVNTNGGSIPVAWVGRLNHKGWSMLRAVWFQPAVRPLLHNAPALV